MTTPPDILTHPHLALKARYRMGDQVAALTLVSLIESRRSMNGVPPATWYAPDGVAMTNLAGVIGADVPVIYPHTAIPAMAGGDREGEHYIGVNDANLWQWNWLFKRIGYRLPMKPGGAPRIQSPQIVFAPLMECGYSTERVMHPRFVEDVIEVIASAMLAPGHDHYGMDFSVIMPHNPSLATRDVILAACLPRRVLIVQGPLPGVAQRIAESSLFIGGDTGLSHLAGCFASVAQIGLHDRVNTEYHVEREFDHQQYTRGMIVEMAEMFGIQEPSDGWQAMTYDSFPNKPNLTRMLFDHNGMDGVTVQRVADHVAALLTEWSG